MMKFSDELIHQVLQEKFGFSSFLNAQEGVIRQLLEGRSTLAIMPTGSGKSLCFQLPALIFEGLTLVVSPMISLMKDQVMQLSQLGIPARMYNSMISPEEQQIVLQELSQGKIKLLYVAPETLMKEFFLQNLENHKPSLIAIDEAHCISMWGHDFRPEYRQLASLRSRFPDAVCFALTATAIPKVRTDICEILDIPPENQVVESFDRPNLLLAVEPKQNSYAKLLQFLKQHQNESGIIYCMTRKKVDDLTEKLLDEGYSVLPYHAGLSDKDRHTNQEAFIRDETQIMVATIAFGMGINKSNIRFVLHMDLPKSLETYYQEIGRAGRDGLPSTCLLFFSLGDLITLKKIIFSSDNSDLNHTIQQHLEAMVTYAETGGCRRKPILNWFGESYTEPNCGMCDNCLRSETEMMDATVQAQKFLSAIYRGQEAYSAENVIKILRGSKAKEVLESGADKLSVYGIGKDWPTTQWYSLFQALKQARLIQIGFPNYRLILNPEAWPILKNESTFSMPKSLLTVMMEPAKDEFDLELFELLTQLRRSLANERRVPPYVIFSDKVLRDLARYYPQDLAAFTQINGIGEYKTNQFGEMFTSLIKEYCAPLNLPQIAIPAPDKIKAEKKIISRTVQIADFIKAGHTLQEAMVEFGIQLGTIAEHLQRYLESDGKLESKVIRASSTLAPEDFARIEKRFSELGMAQLSPIYLDFNEEFSYLELRLVRLFLLARISESQ